jgi:anti-anti-sigma factor
VTPQPAGEEGDAAAPVPAPAAESEAALVVRAGPHGPLLEPSGELDLAAVGRLRPEVLAAVGRPGTEAVVDLRAVGYLASAGVGLLLEAAAAARVAGSRIRVRVASGGGPDRVLGLTGLAGDLQLERD